MTTTPRRLNQYLSPEAIECLAEQYDISLIESAWGRGKFGDLHSQKDGSSVGKATLRQAIESYEAYPDGFIEVDGATVSVAP